MADTSLYCQLKLYPWGQLQKWCLLSGIERMQRAELTRPSAMLEDNLPWM